MKSVKRSLLLGLALVSGSLFALDLPDGFSPKDFRDRVKEQALAMLNWKDLKTMAQDETITRGADTWIRSVLHGKSEELQKKGEEYDDAVEVVAAVIEQYAADFMPRRGIEVSVKTIEMAFAAVGNNKVARAALSEAADKWVKELEVCEGVRAVVIQILAQYTK